MNSSRNNKSRLVPSGGFSPNYTSTTAMVMVGVIGLSILSIYFYNMYKDFKAKSLEEAKNNIKPPECPDYWVSLGNKKCKNTMKLGKCNRTDGNDVIDFNNVIFTNANTGDYSKCKWARACDVYWSGVDRAC